MPGPLAALALIGGAIGAGSLLQRFWARLDPSSPHGKDAAVAQTLQVFAEAETARTAPTADGTWEPLHGLDKIVAADAIEKQFTPSMRLDFARVAEPEKLREWLGLVQRQAIEKAREDPASVSFGDPWKVAWTQLKRGSFLEGIGGVTESIKRDLDILWSRKTGVLDSFGRNFARDAGIEEGDTAFGPISGTLDFGTVLLGDPLLIAGKGVKITRGALIAGQVEGRLGATAAASLGAPLLKTAEGKVFADTANWAVRMPGVRKWAEQVAKESNPGTVLWWERMGGGVIDSDELRRLMAATTDPAKIQAFLAEGLRRGSVYRLPVWGGGPLRNKLSLLARTQYTNYGRRVWNEALDVNDPNFENDFFTLHRYFHDKAAKEKGSEWLEQFVRADRDQKISVTERMVNDGLKRRARDITQPHAAKLAKKAGVEAKTWDDLAARVSSGPDEALRDRAKALGLSVSNDLTGEGLQRSIREAVESMPAELADQATDNLKRFAGGYFTQKERAYGYVPGHGLFDMPMFSTQTERHMLVPSYQSLYLWENELHSLAGARGMGRKAWGRLSHRLDRFTAPWRGLVLSTPRTFLRNTSDDMIAAMAHPEWGGRVLRNLAWGAWDLAAGSGFPGRPFFRLAGRVRGAKAGSLAGRVREGVEEASLAIPDRELARHVNRSEKFLESLVAPSRIRQATTWNRVVGFGGAIDGEVEKTLSARTMAEADWSVWRPVNRKDPAFPETLHHFINHQVLQDDAVKHILGNLDEPERAVAMIRAFADSEFGQMQRRLAGKLGETTEDFARLKRDLIHYAIPDELMPYAKTGYVPPEKIVELWKRHPEKLPEFVTGPSTLFNSSDPDVLRSIGSLSKLIAKTTDWTFGTAGAAADMLGRNRAWREAFLDNFHRLEAQAKQLTKRGIDVPEDEIVLRARQNAERQVLELVDNFNDRTRIGVLSRGYLSFLDAHLRFWKRWGRIALRNPGHLEKVRLLFGAGESLGWIEPDDHGNLVFTAPIAPQLAAALLPGDTDLYKSWFSMTVGAQSKVLAENGPAGVVDLAENLGKVIVPKGLPFSVDVIPGFSPLFSTPVDRLTLNMPGIREVTDRVLGQAPRYDPEKGGLADTVIYSFFPAWMKDVFRVFEDEDSDVIKGQAVADALKYEMWKFAKEKDRMPASPEEAEDVYKRAQNTAQHALIGKVLARLFSPYSQSRVPYGKEAAEDWHHFRARHGPEIGFDKFMEKYGEGAIGYTIPTSRVEVGAPLNYSDDAERFYLSNPDFFRDHPQVAGFFTRDMPGFDLDVFSRMRARGERSWIPPKQLLAEAFYRLGNREYYEVIRPQYLAAKAQASGQEEQRELALWLDVKRAEIDAKYPGWQNAYAAAASNSQMRELAIGELRQAIRNPAVADTKAAQATAQFLNHYDEALKVAYDAGFSTLGGRDFLETRRWLAAKAQNIAVTSGSEGFRSVYEFMFRPMLERLEDEHIPEGSPRGDGFGSSVTMAA